MSKLPSSLGPLDLFDPSMEHSIEEYAIGGKMLTVKMTVDAVNELVMDDLEWRKLIRHKLATQLATAMLEQDLVETTTFYDPATLCKIIAARCYLAPQAQVKILRVHKK